MSGRWADSTRRARLPADWARRTAATRRRAGGRCECQGDCGQHVSRCPSVGTDTDHKAQSDNHDLANLQLLCRPCHKVKTQREAKAAAAAKREAIRHPATRVRHPGLM